MRYITLGTAGHIDHGKSTLVEALTGINPDRLKEEKERGITIDLGFAFLDFPDNLRIGIVDVPGHERLVKNMLAGAGGIDIVLLVIAADEGIMPQTREHLSICDLLRIKKGLIAVTKQDMVEEDWLSMVIEDIKKFVRGTFLEGSPIIPVSSKTGYNLDTLKNSIKDIALNTETRSSEGLFRLPVDRVFSMKGFGTVVTGTIISGKTAIEDTVEILPKGIKSRIRGMQSHDQKVSEAFAGQRTALNLQGIEKMDIIRGDVVAMPGFLIPSSLIDVKIEMLGDIDPLKNNSRIRFHICTSEVIGRIMLLEGKEIGPEGKGYARIRLENPIVSMTGDRFIIRRFSPLQTLGGGVILDTSPERRRIRHKILGRGFIEGLSMLEKGSLEDKLSYKILSRGFYGADSNSLNGCINSGFKEIANTLERLKVKGEITIVDGKYINKGIFNSLKKDILSKIEEFHKTNPIKAGMPKEYISSKLKVKSSTLEFRKTVNSALEELEKEGKVVLEQDKVRLSSFRVEMKDHAESKERLLELYRKEGIQPPMKEDLSRVLKMDEKVIMDLLKLSVENKQLIKINDSLYMDQQIFNNILERLKVFFREKKEITVAEFRDMLKTSRKYAVPIMEYLDGIKFTLRVGDKRVLRLRPEPHTEVAQHGEHKVS